MTKNSILFHFCDLRCGNSCLVSTAQTKDQVQCGLLLDVVVSKCATVLQLLSSKDQSLLVWGNALLVLDLLLDVLNGIGSLHLESDGLAGQSLDEDLHSTAQTKHQVQCGLLQTIFVNNNDQTNTNNSIRTFWML
jgi:hypothetical protein